MNKKGIIWFLAIPLIIIGLVVAYFIIKAVVGLLITAIMWTIVLGFIVLTGYVVYLLIKWTRKK